jgi:HAD superfamily hydrolase (TIGR01509 family)
MIKGVVFDLDGTLIDSTTAFDHAWARAFQDLGYNVSPEDIEALGGGLSSEDIIRLIAPQELEHKEILKSLRKKYFLQELLAGKVKLFEGVKDVIEYLNRKGIKKAIATSMGKDVLEIVDKQFELSKEFVIVTAEEVRKGKPEPDIFIEAFKRIKINPKEGIIVGDSKNDLIPAREIGSIAILVRNLIFSNYADYVAKDMKELLKLLRNLIER